MKHRKERKNRTVTMILAAMVIFISMSIVPASAFELAMATGDSPTQKTGVKIQQVQSNPAPQQLLHKKSLKDLIELPQP